MTFDIVIPARNEEATIAEVVRAARGSHAARVVVVDDHSSDATADTARAAGADVILSKGRGNKALALATGVEAAFADVIVFFDADILAARPDHFDLLARPVIESGFAMSCGLVDRGSIRNTIFLRLPPITGLRAVRRDVFAAIPPEKLNGFQIEIMINEVVARGRMKTSIRVLRGTSHRTKVHKLGRVDGTKAHVSMTMELLHCLTFVPLWTYGSYLSNLTVLE